MRCNYDNVILFFFNDTATTEIYTLSLHDALPILFDFRSVGLIQLSLRALFFLHLALLDALHLDRKSTRLNSSHSQISYAVFCLKKKNKLSYARAAFCQRDAASMARRSEHSRFDAL